MRKYQKNWNLAPNRVDTLNMTTFVTAYYWYFYFTREGSGVGGGL
jgi:hypothetical protein